MFGILWERYDGGPTGDTARGRVSRSSWRGRIASKLRPDLRLRWSCPLAASDPSCWPLSGTHPIERPYLENSCGSCSGSRRGSKSLSLFFITPEPFPLQISSGSLLILLQDLGILSTDPSDYPRVWLRGLGRKLGTKGEHFEANSVDFNACLSFLWLCFRSRNWRDGCVTVSSVIGLRLEGWSWWERP